LQQSGIKVTGGLRQGETPAGAKVLLLHESKPLSDILRDLNHFSSNFLAGQILYALGQDSVGYFRQDIGVKRLSRVLEDLGFAPEQFNIVDASGLDRGNQLTTDQLVRVLQRGAKDFRIAPNLIASLSRFGRSGTLKSRKLLEPLPAPASSGQLYQERFQRADGVWGKTGTLDGVSSLAGYLETRLGERLAFAVITNGGLSKDRSIEIEDGLVQTLIEVR
jgi:D-alanyl-D-alanine carboxypeptidase/D-alanyl-D-alanine-endopeptidase (penicillin-binding protein 4)